MIRPLLRPYVLGEKGAFYLNTDSNGPQTQADKKEREEEDSGGKTNYDY